MKVIFNKQTVFYFSKIYVKSLKNNHHSKNINQLGKNSLLSASVIIIIHSFIIH